MANLFYKLLGMFSLTDDYDDDEDLDDDDDFDDEEEEASRFQIKKKEKARSRSNDDDYPAEKPEKKSSNVLPYNKKSAKNNSAMGVCVIKPVSFEDGREISDTLSEGKAVILNLEDVDGDLAQRVIDFTCGACYSMGGKLQKVSTFIFIVTPSSVDISGDFQELLNSAAASSMSMSMPGNNQSMMQMQSRYRF